MGKLTSLSWMFQRLLRWVRAIRERIIRWQKQKLLGQRLEKLFTDSLASSEEGFIRVFGREASLSVINVELRPLFTDPHENTMPLQRKVAEKLFSLVGATYLPRRLLLLLKRFDAFQTVDLFLAAIGLEYSDLLMSNADREFLEKALHALVEADALFLESGLSDIPFFVVIAARDIEAVEAGVERLRKAVSVLKSLKASEIVFPDYILSFLDDAMRLIEDWHRLDDFTVNEIYETHCAWRGLQERYNSVNGQVDDMVPWLKEYIPDGHVLKSTLYEIIKEDDRLRRAVETGGLEPAYGIEALESILEELTAIREAILDEMGYSESEYSESRWDGRYSEVHIKRYMEVLHLTYPDDLNLTAIKKAFRNLAMVHHPDRGGDAEQFKKIKEAYHFLTRIVEKEEIIV